MRPPIYKAVNPLSKWQLAWLAGFIDGEGSIGIHTTKCGGAGGKTTPRLVVSNTCISVIELIYKMTGVGFIQYIDHSVKNPAYSKAAVWSVQRAFELKDIMTKILPYLLVKTDQAIMMLEYCDGKISGEPLHDDIYYSKKTKELNSTVRNIDMGVLKC